jgi:hypothetical protein
MGRFYSGDIEGKFWFGVQDSDDIKNLVTIKGNNDYSWKVCNCVAEIDDSDYCRNCYESKNEHIEQIIEEEEYEDECLYYEECCCGYSLDKETHYEELQETIRSLKKQIPNEIIQEFDKIEQNDKILDAFTGVFDDSVKKLNKIDFDSKKEKNNQTILIARYTLGYQIEYCLRKTGSCNVNCDY